MTDKQHTLDAFIDSHNIHIIALTPILNYLKEAVELDSLEDVKEAMQSTLYDMTCLSDLIVENSDALWGLKS